uniref:Cytochrome c oxidase subunit 2 n=1 Tax=Heterodoxus spiniger TaxID=762516 RepID=A0A7T1M864_9NEOP|nr:cytochrome c oxidase subunit 2 [Heterodoxus spiniger]
MFNLSDGCSLIMENMVAFHDFTLMILLFITTVVLMMLISIMITDLVNRFLIYNEVLEFIWTVIPSFILLIIALPSLKILYLVDELLNPEVTVKVIGNQWYWSYQYSDLFNIEFDSYMKKWEGLSDFKYLDVDNRTVLPVDTNIRMIITSSDVIHSWTIPSLGVKLDANPGRLNQLNILGNRLGLFYGQCSEICGILHSFMPICVEMVKPEWFLKWLNSF